MLEFYTGPNCLVLRVERLGAPFYVIANGMSMGRLTRFFGPHCLADTSDCKEFLRNQQRELYTDGELLEVKVTIDG